MQTQSQLYYGCNELSKRRLIRSIVQASDFRSAWDPTCRSGIRSLRVPSVLSRDTVPPKAPSIIILTPKQPRGLLLLQAFIKGVDGGSVVNYIGLQLARLNRMQRLGPLPLLAFLTG